MARTKAADEVFCRSCGETIKKEAEICPNCGVRNAAYEASKRQDPDSSLTAYSSQNSTDFNVDSFLDEYGSIVAWILGILILLAGLGTLTEITNSFIRSILGGGILMATGAFTLPPVREEIIPIMEEEGIPTSRGVLIVIGCTAFAAGTIISP